jgi:hypothetical protein
MGDMLTVNFRQPSHEFTFNVGIDLLFLLTQNVHLAPSTQQAEQAGFTRAKNHKTCQSIFPEN